MTAESAAMPAGLTREEMKDWLRESGLLDELREELAAELPVGRFSASDEGGGIEFSRGAGSGGFPWIYWRKRDGRIITGPEPRETMYRIYQKKGYEPLPQYGLLPTPGARVPCCPGRFMRTDQFHCMLARGGAKEFSLEQVVLAGWHQNPPVVHGQTVAFPQLDGKPVETIQCDECDKSIYGLRGTNMIVQGLRQHASAAHKFNRREVDEMLWRIGYYSEPKRQAPAARRTPQPSTECLSCGEAIEGPLSSHQCR